MLHIHYFQHVAFEDLGCMESYLQSRGHRLSSTHFYSGQTPPSIGEIDWLIVMGGPMGVQEEAKYPWLRQEKDFIREAIEKKKMVLGICLGAQLIADVLGARVFKNEHREIGWFPVNRSNRADNTILESLFPNKLEVFHWHGDTFEMPDGASLVASSKACRNQGFVLEDRVIGFQFHLETTVESAQALIDNCREELRPAPFVQTETEIISSGKRFSQINQVMVSILKRLEVSFKR